MSFATRVIMVVLPFALGLSVGAVFGWFSGRERGYQLGRMALGQAMERMYFIVSKQWNEQDHR